MPTVYPSDATALEWGAQPLRGADVVRDLRVVVHEVHGAVVEGVVGRHSARRAGRGELRGALSGHLEAQRGHHTYHIMFVSDQEPYPGRFRMLCSNLMRDSSDYVLSTMEDTIQAQIARLKCSETIYHVPRLTFMCTLDCVRGFHMHVRALRYVLQSRGSLGCSVAG